MIANSGADQLNELVESVYDAVGDAALWPRALGNVATAFDSVLAMVAVADTAMGHARFQAAHGDPALLAPLMAEGVPDLPFYAGIARMEIDVPITLDMLYAIQGEGTRQSWLQSRINLEWAQPNRLDDFFWVALMKQPARVGSLILITSRDRPQIAAQELERFALLAPHVRRAVTIGDMFERERSRSAAFRAVVDALSCAVLIVDRNRRVLHANPVAEALLSQEALISARQDQLSIAWQPAEQAVACAIELGMRDECALGPAGINVPLAQAARPAVAHVLPLARRDASARVRQEAVAAIFIAEAGVTVLPAMDAVAALFGLTAAEKRVATQIAQGMDRGEIAAANAVSDGTVKSQLASIYDKTGTGDKRDLSLLVRALTPPVQDGS